MTNNESQLCCQCGGECCKYYPGAFLPEDIDFKMIADKLQTHEWAVDWWDDDPPMYFLRPAVKDDDRIMSPAWHGECFYLTPNGCALVFDERPSGCQGFVPKASLSESCTSSLSKYEVAIAWQPDEKKLLAIVASLTDGATN